METSSHKRVYGRAELLALLGWDPNGLAEPYRLTEAGVTFEPDPQTWPTLTEEERGALAPSGWDGSDRPVLPFPFSSDELLHFVESSAQPKLMRWRNLSTNDTTAFCGLESHPLARDLAQELAAGTRTTRGEAHVTNERESTAGGLATQSGEGWEAREFALGWYEATLRAKTWFRRRIVRPVEAAMLLCGHDPKETFKPERAEESGSDASPGEQYGALLRLFEEEAVIAQQHRTLLDWLDVARREELRYDPWIDFYVKENSLGEVAAAVVPEPEIVAAASGDRCAGNEIELASSDLLRVAAQLDVSSHASASTPAIPEWKSIARGYAYQYAEEKRLKRLRPSQRAISHYVAKRMLEEGVQTENRTFPTPETLRRHVLFPLQPPSGAKLAQLAQIEQDPK